MAGRPRLWHHPDFLLFWLGQSVSLVGLQFGALALPLVAITTLGAGVGQVGILAGLSTLPWLLFGLVVGVGLDRARRKPVLVAAHLLRAALLLTIPLAAALGRLTLVHLYAATFLVGTLAVGFETARHAYLPSLVDPDDLAEANSKPAMTDGARRVAGPGLAGAATQWLGPPAAVAAQAALLAVAGLCTWRIRRAESAPAPTPDLDVLGALREGLAYLWRARRVRALVLSDATFLFFFAAMQAVLVVFLTRRLGLAPGTIGALFAVGGVGGVLGALVAHQAARRLPEGRLILLGSALRCGGLMLIPLSLLAGPFAVAVIGAARVVHAFGWTLWQVYQETALQRALPARLRGRVSGGALVLMRTGESLGGFAGAGLAATLGVSPTLVIAVLGTALGTAWLLPAPRRRGAAATDVRLDTATGRDT